ncbi:helix-turn-helix domain-containing protein [Desulfoluna spongiiphila]|uniref:helix-turn-helix domain-containing protein n=1 Tax=Desulfoluna spongiiphila TaxID=419481 RepID=UPI001D00C9DF|nr:AraC family transcriptional regulator [Desulfoluna spongiiphila]
MIKTDTHPPGGSPAPPLESGTPYGITHCSSGGAASKKPRFQMIPVKPGITLVISQTTTDSAMVMRFEMDAPPVQFHCCLKGRCRHCFDGLPHGKRELWTRPGTFSASYPAGASCGECEMRSGEKHVTVGIHMAPELFLEMMPPSKTPCATLPGMLSPRGNKAPFIFQTGITPAMESVARQIVEGPPPSLSPPLFFQSKAIELLCLQLARLERVDIHASGNPLRKREDRERIFDARNHLIQNMKAPLSPEELARMTGLNVFKLKSGFKELFGVTLFEYLRCHKMETAKRYLMEGELNVSETAWEVGYTNVSHFIRAYKKQHGVNPGDVARSSKTARQQN